MVFLRVVGLNIPEGSIVLSTTWQFGTSDSFENSSLILHEIEDPLHLYNLYKNIEVTEGVQYYSRCRMILSTGLTEWSNVEIGIVSNTNEQEQLLRFSSPILAPTITLQFEDESQPRSYIRAHIDRYVMDNNIHSETTWLIEDVKGDIIFISKKDPINITDIVIPAIIDLRQVYSIKAKIHMVNNDVSTFGCRTFFTSDEPKLLRNHDELIINTKSLSKEIDFRKGSIDYDNIDVEVYSDVDKIYDNTINVGFVSVYNLLINRDESKKFFILRSRITKDNIKTEWTYRFIRLASRDYILPALLPYNLTHEFTWEPEQ